MSSITRAIKRYWFDTETNIFRNYIDALCGAVVLIALPGVSLASAIFVDTTTWENYLFPIVSICLAGAYDTYGRYEPNSPKNIKLIVRVVLDFLAIFLSAIFVGEDNLSFRLIAPILMLITGLSIVAEVIRRVITAIELSPWYSRW